MKLVRAVPVLAAMFALSFACGRIDDATDEGDDPVKVSERLQQGATASPATAAPAGNLETQGLRKHHCCIARFSGGGRNCADFDALPAFASSICTVAAELEGATSSSAHRGRCREFESCPQYVAPDPGPTPPSDPPPPRRCPAGQRCCAPMPDGSCYECFPNGLNCP